MKVLFFDCFSGISGDMTLGALLDLGIDKDAFLSELKKLNLAGYQIKIEKKVKSAIAGTDVDIILDKNDGELQYDKLLEEERRNGPTHSTNQVHEHSPHEHTHNHEQVHSHDHLYHHSHSEKDAHSHEHAHDHDHLDNHTHSHEVGHNHGLAHSHTHDNSHSHDHSHSHVHRNLADIENIINSSDIKIKAKNFALKVFREIARAEAKVHNKTIEEIHFHEVGAVDSIVDIVGVSICLDMLGVDVVFSSPLHEGKGFVKCQHGLLPIPVPAVLEILNGGKIPLIIEDVNSELVTPTGVALIKSMCNSFGNMPAMIIDKVGYGFGKRETGRLNALRVMVGTMFGEDSLMEEIAVIETNIDDLQPEILGYTMDKLFEEGALDVFYSPIYMKKNRPSSMLSVICKKEDEAKLVDVIFKETSTLGVRRRVSQRYALDRKIERFETELGQVRFKTAEVGQYKKITPEYEDCREIAKRTGIPLLGVYDIVKKGIGN